MADVADSIADLYCGHPSIKALLCHLDQLRGLSADLPDGKGSGTVAVVALIKGTYVDFHDVTLFKKSLLGRDSVDDFVVDADTRAGGKTAVAEEGGLCARLCGQCGYRGP